MKRKKVAILASRFPYPLTKGDKLRMYQHLKQISKFADVHLICLEEKLPEEKSLAEIQSLCKGISIHILSRLRRRCNIIRHYFGTLPMQVRYFYDATIHNTIKREIRSIQPDHIYVQLIRMAPYLEGIEDIAEVSLDFMDSMGLNDLAMQYLSPATLKPFRLRERRLVSQFELKLLQTNFSKFIISERDKMAINQNDHSDLHILSNGVDTEYFHYRDDTQERQYDLLFCGNLSYKPNEAAALFIVKKLYPRLENLKIVISGADLSHALKLKLEKYVNTQDNTEGSKSLNIGGFVPDIRDVYLQSKILIVPIFTGSGQQNKVLEAMACGTICIVTSFVNEGILAKDGTHLLIAHDVPSFIKHINSLLSHPENRRKISKAARTFVEQNYDWAVNSNVLCAIIKNDSKI